MGTTSYIPANSKAVHVLLGVCLGLLFAAVLHGSKAAPRLAGTLLHLLPVGTLFQFVDRMQIT